MRLSECVKRAAAQVINDVKTFGAGIEAVSQSGRRRFAQKTKNIQTGKLCGVFSRLTLSVIKVSRYRHNSADKFAA